MLSNSEVTVFIRETCYIGQISIAAI